MPLLHKAYQLYGDEIHFLLVDITDGEWDTEESVKAFVEESGYGFPVLFDNDLDASRTYEVYSIPMTVFIHADGSMYTTYIGAMTEEVLKDGIQGIYSADK